MTVRTIHERDEKISKRQNPIIEFGHFEGDYNSWQKKEKSAIVYIS